MIFHLFFFKSNCFRTSHPEDPFKTEWYISLNFKILRLLKDFKLKKAPHETKQVQNSGSFDKQKQLKSFKRIIFKNVQK